MGKLFATVFIIAALFVLMCAPAYAAGDGGGIPDQVTMEHWSCKSIADLAEKYNADRRLPDSVVVEGKTCSRGELAKCLLSVMEKCSEICEKEGSACIPDEDREKINALFAALKDELSRDPVYLQKRETIERLLARPEVPAFLARVGVGGFLRGEGVGNFRLPDFSYRPGHAEGRFLYRIKPYVYWHPTDYLDVHVEAQGYGYEGSDQDFGRFNLYQGFVEARLPGRDLLALKVGRQEFTYGSAFILGPNSFYDGLSFDAARLTVKPVDGLSLDLLGGFYATAFNGGLAGDLEGVYGTCSFGGRAALEGYFFRDTGHAVSTGRRPGEQLLIYGLRGKAEIGPFSVELEPVLETGSVFNTMTSRNDDIGAYGGHADIAIMAEILEHRNRFVWSFSYGSGDMDAAEGVDLGGEFHNPDNDTSLVGDMNVVGDLSGVSAGGHHASGIQGYTLGWGVDLTDRLNFTSAGHYFRANGTEAGLSRDIGTEADFTITYSISDNLSLIAEYSHFFTGGFFHDSTGSGDDISYGYVMLNFDFNVTKMKRPRI